MVYITMDEESIQQYFQTKQGSYSTLSHQEVLNELHHKEYVEIEDLKDILFEKKLDYLLLANQLKQAMLVQTGYKQLKRYLVNEMGMSDDKAKSSADKYNKASRTYKKFNDIIRNVAAHPKLDITDLTISELHLAVREDWVRRRSAIVKGAEKKTTEENEGEMKEVDSNSYM